MADIASQAGIRAVEPFVPSASKLCVYLWDEAWQHAPQVLKGDDEALRRLRSTLENCAALKGSSLRPDIAKEMRAERQSLSKLGDALGAVRDFDVLCAYLQNYIETERQSESNEDLDLFFKYLHERRDEHFAPMTHAIERANRPRKKREEFARWAHSLAGVREPDVPLLEAARQVLALRIDEALEMGPVLQSSDEHEQHNLRKSLRRLRYTLEAFAPAFTKPKAFIKTLTSMQDELGEMQDRSVLRAMLLSCFEQKHIKDLPPGAHEFAQFGEAKRDELLQQMRATWDQHIQQGLWDSMRKA